MQRGCLCGLRRAGEADDLLPVQCFLSTARMLASTGTSSSARSFGICSGRIVRFHSYSPSPDMIAVPAPRSCPSITNEPLASMLASRNRLSEPLRSARRETLRMATIMYRGQTLAAGADVAAMEGRLARAITHGGSTICVTVVLDAGGPQYGGLLTKLAATYRKPTSRLHLMLQHRLPS
jgi:hypothetical protein